MKKRTIQGVLEEHTGCFIGPSKVTSRTPRLPVEAQIRGLLTTPVEAQIRGWLTSTGTRQIHGARRVLTSPRGLVPTRSTGIPVDRVATLLRFLSRAVARAKVSQILTGSGGGQKHPLPGQPGSRLTG